MSQSASIFEAMEGESENVMNDQQKGRKMQVDPVTLIANFEKAWNARDAVSAAADFTQDAVQYYGAGQQRSGQALRDWPGQWFAYAKDLKIKKTYRAHSENCIASTWDSVYTDPKSGKSVFERGAELFYLRGTKIYEHHMWQHSWKEGEKIDDGALVTD